MSLLVPNNKPLNAQQEIAENALTEAFALDLITMEELEKRLYQVHGAHSNSEITSYLEDLPPDLLTSSREETAAADPSNSDIEKGEKKQTTILSSNLLCGAKLRRKRINAKVVLGEHTLDYSKTILEPGKYFINLKTIFGDTKIIVPPEYAVTSEIRSILSEVKNKTHKEPDVNTPVIIITGKAILSSVTIKEKNSGFIEKIKRLFLD
jgi:hypothetical protein